MYFFFLELMLFILYLDLGNCIWFAMTKHSILYFTCCPLDVITLKHLLPSIHSVCHFVILVELTLFISIPMCVLVFGIKMERILKYVLTFAAINGSRRNPSKLWLVKCKQLVHNDGFFPILFERVLNLLMFTLITFSFWLLI